VLGNERKSLLAALAAIMLVIGLFRGGLTLLQYSVIARLGAKISLVGTSSFVERLIRLPMGFYLERSVGDLSQRAGYNSSVASLLATQMAASGIALIGAIGYAALLIYYNWIIGSVVIVLSMLNVVALRLVLGQRTRNQGRVITQQNKLRGTTTSSIQGIETIKSTGMEDDVFKTLTGQQAEYISASAALVPSSAMLASIPVLLNSLTQASILVIGGWLTITGDFTIGSLLAVSALAANLNSPVQTLMNTGSQLQVVTSSLQALDDVLANPVSDRFTRRVMDPNDPIPDYSGPILIDGISFDYGENAPLVIDNLTLELTPGKRVALVGGSGSGKTTIANLAAGIYQPTSGQILYDGKPMSEYPIGVLERYISKVDQSIVLFEGTVRDNVTLWDPTIPTDQIKRALADAQVLNDVLARDKGIDCFVSENGRNFSGGQAQRIEIARALVLDPRIIVLDEATSALDGETESDIANAIKSLQ
jgi:ABC-type bacteriocin/lantibiotic exporter with double-glycine peptidase domain